MARAVDDQLVSFQKFEGNPVISVEPLPGLVGFRDHAVRRVNGELRQLIGSGSAALGGCLLEYRSKDLASWDYCGVFLSGITSGLPGQMWECPDFFELDGRSFLVVSLLEGRAPAGGHVDRGRMSTVTGSSPKSTDGWTPAPGGTHPSRSMHPTAGALFLAGSANTKRSCPKGTGGG